MKTLILIFLSIFFLSSCNVDNSIVEKEFSFISYNIQTFFDDEESGNEFSPFLKSDGWNTKKYRNRLEKLRSLIKSDTFSSDIIFFQEIENERVLEDLLDLSLRRRGYIYYGVVVNNSPISVGYISKHSISSVNSHVSLEGRAIIDIELFINGIQTRFLSLHAKSNLGGVEETEEERVQLSKLLNMLIKDYEGIPLILCGDFNSDPSRRNEKASILQLEYYSDEVLKKSGSLVVTSDINNLKTSILYSPFLDPNYPLLASGTYFYENEWYCYDHIFFSQEFFSDFGIKFKSFEIINTGEIAKYNKPFRYDSKTEEGYSDHFAVKAIISYN